MPSGLLTRTSSLSVIRRLTPWAVVLLIGALLIGILPAQAQNGSRAVEAIPIGTDGKFRGTGAAAPRPHHQFNSASGVEAVLDAVTFDPDHPQRLAVLLFPRLP